MRGAMLALLLAGLTARLPAQTRAADPSDGFDGYVARAVADWNVPGLAIAVVRNDSVLFARGYGVRRLGSPERVSIHTLFANASTTKAFTALTIGLLVDGGSVQWDTPARQYLPELTLADLYASREVTIRDLLSHRIGFGDPAYLWYGIEASDAEILRRLPYVRPQSSFRSRYAYNNIGYAVAGMIAARVAGTTWDELVRTRILEPLGMRETVTRSADLVKFADVAYPHDAAGNTLRPIEASGLVDGIAPAGAMYSTVSDMAIWLRFLLNRGRLGEGRLVSDSVLDELFRPQTLIRREQFYPTAALTGANFTAYGLGWFLQDYRGDLVAFHTGSIDGMVAIVGLLPARRLGVVVFANRDHAELRHALLFRAFDVYGGYGTDRDWSAATKQLYDSLDHEARERRLARDRQRITGTTPSLPLQAYAGIYADSAYGTVEIRLDGTRLVLRRSSFLQADLEHWHFDTFRAVWRNRWIGDELVTFGLGPDGNAASLEIGAVRLRRIRSP